MSPPSLTLRLRQKQLPYGYRGLKITTSLSYVSMIFSVGRGIYATEP
ncbi:hypothetical protein [Bathymodiolus japonicus methanotrophic gill symbiont]|nr:hypothetical protein [Bathymodiolus japonicus methanotrophic gill symbiont]